MQRPRCTGRVCPPGCRAVRMKILVSAYACEPDKGSEPAVGWNWVQALVRRGYQVHVVTRSNNRQSIERAIQGSAQAVRFHYFDLSNAARRWKRLPGGIYFYYLFWQMGAARLANRLHETERFDLVHHVTFASFRQPSFMGKLGIPFIFGPVGGGESMPVSLRRGLPVRNRIAEATRELGNSLIALDPFMRSTFARACIIACTTEETMARIPPRFREKCVVQLAIGINESEISLPRPESNPSPHFLFVGRLLYWKGLHLLFRALAEARRSVPEVKLKIIGTGGDRDWIKLQAKTAGVMDLVEWVPSTPHKEIAREYRESRAFVFPSLHDSGGMVVIEALAAALPVVCLDLGGPGTIVTPECGVVIGTGGKDENSIVRELASAVIHLAGNDDERARMSANAVGRARQLTWDRAAEAVYSALEARTGLR